MHHTRNRLRPLLLLIGALSLIGCTKNGTLVISNESSGILYLSIASIETTLDAGEEESRSWKMSSTILSKETKKVPVEGIGLYVFAFDEEYEITAGSTTREEIYADGGAIAIVNDHPTLSIVEAYLSPSSDATWGSNDLSSTITPGTSYFWTVSAGSWDVRIVDNLDAYYDIYGISVSLNNTQVLTFSAAERVEAAPGFAKRRPAQPVEIRVTVDRVQEFPPPYF